MLVVKFAKSSVISKGTNDTLIRNDTSIIFNSPLIHFIALYMYGTGLYCSMLAACIGELSRQIKGI